MLRRATLNDLSSIINLYSSYLVDFERLDDSDYVARIQKNGFIVQPDTSEDFQERILDSPVFNVYEMEETFAGFIEFRKAIYFPEEADNVIWFDDQLKDNYYHNEQTICLHVILLRPIYVGMGLGGNLLNPSLAELKKQGYEHVYSIVTLGPITNCRSITFHANKYGFSRAGVTMPKDLFGLSNYQSLLFHKSL